MERRKFMIGLGSAAAGSAALVGSSAFSFVRADRGIDVNVVDDGDAYLGLEPTSHYAEYDDRQLSLDFAGGIGGQVGDGLNDNADSRFDNVFKITNQGTNDARISFHDDEGEVGYDSPGATWYYSEDGGWEDNEVNEDNPVIGPGEDLYIHVIFWLTDYDEGALPEQLGIVAEEP